MKNWVIGENEFSPKDILLMRDYERISDDQSILIYLRGLDVPHRISIGKEYREAFLWMWGEYAESVDVVAEYRQHIERRQNQDGDQTRVKECISLASQESVSAARCHLTTLMESNLHIEKANGIIYLSTSTSFLRCTLDKKRLEWLDWNTSEWHTIFDVNCDYRSDDPKDYKVLVDLYFDFVKE